MNQRLLCGLSVATLASFLGSGSVGQQAAPAHEDVASVETFLFVQNSSSGTFDGERLTLDAVGPTIFFSDRPYRVFGHVQLDAFIEAWTRGPNSFAQDPPNAILSLIGEDHVDSFLVELSDPRDDAGALSYRVVVENGTIPATFRESSLFIDNDAWAAVGGFAAGHLMARRQARKEAAAYAAGADAKPAAAAQTSSYYYHASAPPPPPPPPPAPPSKPTVSASLDQAIAGMEAQAGTASAQDKQYIEKLIQTIKSVSTDYAKVAN